jgi:hypothetical protein
VPENDLLKKKSSTLLLMMKHKLWLRRQDFVFMLLIILPLDVKLSELMTGPLNIAQVNKQELYSKSCRPVVLM